MINEVSNFVKYYIGASGFYVNYDLIQNKSKIETKKIPYLCHQTFSPCYQFFKVNPYLKINTK